NGQQFTIAPHIEGAHLNLGAAEGLADGIVVVVHLQRAEVLVAKVVGLLGVGLAAQTTLQAADEFSRHRLPPLDEACEKQRPGTIPNSKSQAPNPKQNPMPNPQFSNPLAFPFGHWALGFLICLGFGAWCLKFGISRGWILSRAGWHG